MRQCCLQVRSDQKVEYFPLSASSSTTTSKLLPAAERAETKLKRPKSRPNVNDRIVVVGVVCRGRGQLHTAASYTPGHTCKLELRRRMPPCQAEPLGARRWRDRAREQVGFKRAHQQASISAPSTPPPPPPAIPRPHLLRAPNTTQSPTHLTPWPLLPSGPRPASTSTGLRATSPPFSGVWSLAASAL